MAERKPELGAQAPPGFSVRQRLARIGTRSSAGNPVLEPLFRAVRANHPKADIALIERAFLTAERYHTGQYRKSGEEYITHPLAVTTILAELGMTEPTLVAALLHDTVEDTPYTLAQLRGDFGDEVATLVNGVTKLDKAKYGEHAASETLRKMIVAMSQDIRVLVIKLADRLHNMRTLRHLKAESQERIARETLDIFAPLAHRLGMNTIKWELEDLAFSTLHPKIYDEIVRMVADRAPARDQVLSQVIGQLNADLKEERIRGTVTGRPKHYYSIYQKMVHGEREFTDIYDLIGIRILVEDQRTCYSVLGVLHDRYKPVPARVKDYIAVPKLNLYQSLHTTVIGPQGKPIEMQIRSWDMHRKAEYGVAAHWKYKENVRAGVDTTSTLSQSDLPWVQNLVEFQSELGDSGEFLDSLRDDINSGQVYVFTPRGEIKQLPAKASPVDFAYAVHTEVGHRTIGAKVNGKLVSLESELENGDVVEVFTSKQPNAGPSRDWLRFVKSQRARSKIRHHFTKERRDEAIEKGRDHIAKMLRKENVPLKRVLSHDSLTGVAQSLGLTDVESLYAAVGENSLGAPTVVRKVVELYGGPANIEGDLSEATWITSSRRRRSKAAEETGVIVKGVSDLLVKLARCCTPVPGDQIIGFITRGSGVSVHRDDCTNATDLANQPSRLVEVSWDTASQSTFLVQIQVEALDRARLLSDITMVLSDRHVNILSATLNTSRDRVAKTRFAFEMGDPTHLGDILQAVRGVNGVFDAYRVTQ